MCRLFTCKGHHQTVIWKISKMGWPFPVGFAKIHITHTFKTKAYMMVTSLCPVLIWLLDPLQRSFQSKHVVKVQMCKIVDSSYHVLTSFRKIRMCIQNICIERSVNYERNWNYRLFIHNANLCQLPFTMFEY